MTQQPIPKLTAVAAVRPATLEVAWADGRTARIDLAPWIKGGGALLAPLYDPAVFVTARLGAYDSAVVWGDEEGDLAIDSHHLRLLAGLA